MTTVASPQISNEQGIEKEPEGAVLSSKDRHYGLDFLRAFAVISVVLYHFPKQPEQMLFRGLTHWGWAGVDLFFVLSGFLIGSQYFSVLVRAGPQAQNPLPSTAEFYLKRFFRTLPNYFVVLALHLVFLKSDSVWKFLIFTQNFGIPPFFTESWSLCIEEHFYLLFPWVIFGVIKFRLKGVTIFLLVLTLEVTLRFLIWFKTRPDLLYLSSPDLGYEKFLSEIFYPTYTRLDGLTLGIALAFVKNLRPLLWQKWLAHSGLFGWIGWIFLSLAMLSSFRTHRIGFFGSVFSFQLLAFAFSFFLISVSHSDSFVNRFGRARRFKHLSFAIQKVALLSYSIYLVHVPVMALTWWLFARFGSMKTSEAGLPVLILKSGVAWVLILTASQILTSCIETPFLSLREKLLKKRMQISN